DATAPYTFSWASVAAGSYSVSARAVDSSGATTTTTPISISVGGGGTGGAAPALHVSGNHLVTASGTTYRLLGVNRSSGEFACIQGNGMWDGPADQATIDGMKRWNVHMVRVPLNEECWLGHSDVPPTGTRGAAYQQAVKDWVNLLVANGINVVLDLHWSFGQYSGPGAGCPDVNATCQKPMPDAQFAPTFWSQVATAFKGNDAVIFDLFNEPFPDAANNFSNPTAAWTCLRDGGTCTGIGYQVAGMQSLVNAVRATGATNVIMVGGLTWTNDLSQWMAFKPNDPTGNLIASWHSYNFNACVTTACWDSTIGAVARQVPVLTGEIGQNTCAHDYIDRVMAWADANGVGYAAWTWNPWGVCNSVGNVLILDRSGTPTSTFGEGFRAHLLTQQP
ncbi:MAG TPA: glycoside hydrolase family 5 protein, partial [Kofleriaceae bacterium]|nr:glycoside hydrolase family 5 protein [Kofleriaceae bacterium]